MEKNIANKLSLDRQQELLQILKERFEKNRKYHQNIEWNHVQEKLLANLEKLWSLDQMEITGGEPDVIGYDKKTDEYIFVDCSPETPKGRRSICYDRQALESRKQNKPETSAMDMAFAMGIEMLTEEQYRTLQELGEFDTKTSSWLKTPDSITQLSI